MGQHRLELARARAKGLGLRGWVRDDDSHPLKPESMGEWVSPTQCTWVTAEWVSARGSQVSGSALNPNPVHVGHR